MNSVRVRMFRQGLGDCFLLTFPGQKRDSHVLIDFGVLLGTQDAKDKMRRIAGHILEATSGRLDVIVATHEHWDHLSGFAVAADLLEPGSLEVGEVWLPWTENTGDPQAVELDKRRASTLKHVATATQRFAAINDAAAKRIAGKLDNLLEYWGGLAAAGRRTTRTALDWLRSRTAPKRPNYLEPGMGPFHVPGSDAARVYVLGPPRDQKLLKKSDPSKNVSEVYELGGETSADFGFFAAVESLESGRVPEGQPFEEWFRVSESEAKQRTFFQDHYGFDGKDWRRIESDWLGLAGRLALQLDSDTNNTSLVLAFELLPSRRVLLFPGDAQVGNWLSWLPGEVKISNKVVQLAGLEWKIEENGRTNTVKAEELLARTILYKVGHHGSHNATLKEKGLELMSDQLAAMLPVDRATANKMDWLMPFPSLFDSLQVRTKGRILDLEKGIQTDAAAPPDWKSFPGRAEEKKDWLDLHIDL